MDFVLCRVVVHVYHVLKHLCCVMVQLYLDVAQYFVASSY